MKTTKLLLTIAASAISFSSFAQVKIGDNPTTINAGSVLELESTNKALLMPRISLTNTTTWLPLLGTPVAGMHLYNTNAAITSTNSAYPVSTLKTGEYYYDGTGWVAISTNTSQSLRVFMNGYTITGPAPAGGQSNITQTYAGTTFNNIVGSTIGASSITLPPGKYRASFDFFGNFLDADAANNSRSQLFIDGVLYQNLDGVNTQLNAGISSCGDAIFVLPATAVITFVIRTNLSSGKGFTLQSGSANTSATIEKLE